MEIQPNSSFSSKENKTFEVEEDQEKRVMTIDHSDNDIKPLKKAGIANNFDVKNTTVPEMAKSQYQYGMSIQQSKVMGFRNDAKSQ